MKEEIEIEKDCSIATKQLLEFDPDENKEVSLECPNDEQYNHGLNDYNLDEILLIFLFDNR